MKPAVSAGAGRPRRRVMALLVTQLHPDDEDFKPYRFRVSELEELIADQERTQKALYSRIKALTRGLQEKVLQIMTDTGLLQVSWLSAAEYFTGQGEVELEFSPRLKPYLLQLQQRFTPYKLRHVVKLRSRYSVRLYELLKQYEPLGKRSFDLGELRRMLGMTDGELALWNDFKRFVLERAKQEIRKKTDLGFSYTTRKHVRTVAFVDFEIWSIDHDKPSTKPNDTVGKNTNKTSLLRTKAQQCWDENNGSCGAKWSDHQTATDACHWCRKFEKSRLEAAGQIRLPGT